MSTAVILDSNCGWTRQEAKEYGIFILPMPFIIDGRHGYGGFFSHYYLWPQI